MLAWIRNLLTDGMRLRRRPAMIAIFVLVLATRIGYIASEPPARGTSEMVKTAISLATHGTLADPFVVPTGPSAHVAPGYAFVLSLVYRLFGPGADGRLAADVLTAIATAVQFALLPLVAEWLGLVPLVGVLAALFGLAPVQMHDETSGFWEPVWTALFLMLSIGVMTKWVRKRRLTSATAGGTGALWGAGFLVAPSMLPVFCGQLLATLGLVPTGPARRAVARFGAIVALTAVLIVSPYTLRNYRVLGGLFFIRDNLGLELNVSNRETARATLGRNRTFRGLRIIHPFANPAEAEQVREVGELAYNREKMREAIAWIRSKPAAFAALTGERTVRFWFQDIDSPRNRLLAWALGLGAFVGLGLLIRRDWRLATPLAVLLLTFPLVYYLIQTGERYSYPIRWAQLLLAAWLVLDIARAALRLPPRTLIASSLALPERIHP